MIEFVKMHGCGNDYLFVDCLNRKAPEGPNQLSRKMSDRHFGVGADGLDMSRPCPGPTIVDPQLMVDRAGPRRTV